VVAELADAGFAVAAAAVRGLEIELRWQRGQPIDEELLNAPAPAPNVADLRAWAVAGAEAASGELARARGRLATALARGDLGVGYRHPLLARLIELELTAGDEAAAAAALRALEEATATVRHPWGVTLLLRSRAAIARDVDAAREAVAEAVAAGNKVEAVAAQLVLTRLDAHSGEELVELYRTLDAMGAERLRRQAGELLRARGLQVPASVRGAPGPLGAGELRVARLVQQGLRNREIATQLHYSLRTVEHYVSRIFDKLGVRSRVELARRLDAIIGPAE
jgi:DNA-binding NarL/FixJ family response regulator